MPHEHLVILFAALSIAAHIRERRWAGILPRLYIAAYYFVIWMGFQDVEALRTISRWGFLLLFMTDFAPIIFEEIRRRLR